MSFILRKFKPSEYHILKEWVTTEKWNPCLYDHLAHQLLNGFWMGQLDGQPIACFGAIQYDLNYSHLAWYIVKPEFRSQGYGIQLWNKALSSLTSKTIGLYAVKGKEQSYAKQGFSPVGKTSVYYTLSNGVSNQSDCFLDCRKIDIQTLSSFDRQNFPSVRTKFLQKWINFPHTQSVAFTKNNRIQGYGVIRQAVDGFKIGPLYANQFFVGQQIYKHLAGLVPVGQKVFIEIPDTNPNGLRLAKDWNMTLGSVLTRMYNNGQLQPPIGQNVYGSTAFAFG